MGGISRPSKGVHLSEDIFAGFYWVLRGGESSQLDYIQAGKVRSGSIIFALVVSKQCLVRCPHV